MKAKVTEQGITIPKSLLPDVDEVDIRKRNGVIEVAPSGGDGCLTLEYANGSSTTDTSTRDTSTRDTSTRDTSTRESSGNDCGVAQTYLTLWESIYDSGYFSVPVYFDQYVRSDEGPITLALGKGKREIHAYVSRSETPHGNARVKGGASLRDWFKENYRVEEKVFVSFDSPSKITLGGRVFVPPLEETDSIWDLGKDPIPAEELDIRDVSVNLDKYIYRE